jgi:polar amino acid transport system substrate-binding protein
LPLVVLALALLLIPSGSMAEMRIVRAGGQGVQAPMHFVTAEGAVHGVVVDILAAISNQAGFVVEHVVPVSINDTVDALLAGRIDVTGGTFAITPERAAAVAFSIPYMIQGEALVVRRDDPNDYRSLLDLRGASVGSVRGSNYVRLIEGVPAGTFSDIRYYEFPPDILAAVANGEITAGIYGAPIAAWDIQQGGYEDLKLAENYLPVSTGAYAFATRKDEIELLAAINNALNELMTDGTVRSIFARYGLPYADYTR